MENIAWKAIGREIPEQHSNKNRERSPILYCWMFCVRNISHKDFGSQFCQLLSSYEYLENHCSQSWRKWIQLEEIVISNIFYNCYYIQVNSSLLLFSCVCCFFCFVFVHWSLCKWIKMRCYHENENRLCIDGK